MVAYLKKKQGNNAVAQFYQFLKKVDPITRNCVTSFTSAKSPDLFKVDPTIGLNYKGEGLV